MLPEPSIYFTVKKAVPSQVFSVSDLQSNIRQADYIHKRTISSLNKRSRPTNSQIECYDSLLSNISAQSLLADPYKFTIEFDKSIFSSLINECKLPAMKNQQFEMQEDPKALLQNFAHSTLNVESIEPIPKDDMILVISFYAPTHHRQKTASFNVLSSSKLSDLRDAHYCRTDFESKDTPNTLSKKISSSYFFIQNVFYQDHRWILAENYAQPIQEWISEYVEREGHFGLGKFKTARMEDTRWDQLNLKTNHHYLFTHQGDCTHLVSIERIRMLHQDDSLNALDYPLNTFKIRTISKNCAMCVTNVAIWITVDDIHAPENPCYWCDECFENFHFLENGKEAYEHTFTKHAYDTYGH